MKRCLDLAAMAYPICRPNPMVGAVLVRAGQIISEGYTQAYGGPHAEVMALQHLSPEDCEGAVLYVSLEPCAHHGKTPPCADLILEKGIKTVFIATLDPFEAVDGRGIERLRANGVEVVEGLLDSEARWQNRRFFTNHEKQRPHIVLKWAQSKDGLIDRRRAGGEASRISGPQASQLVHQWRAEEAAILIGGNTARMDDPSLTVRHVAGEDPKRFVWTSKELESNSNLHRLGYEQLNVDHVEALVEALYSQGVQSVLVEGGAHVLQQFIDTGLYDEIRRIIADVNLEEGVSAPLLEASPHMSHQAGADRIEYFKA